MALLGMLQNAADALGIPRPSAIVGSSDQAARMLFALAKEEGRQLATKGRWQRLIKEGNFTTVDGTASYDLDTVASDFNHLINSTLWDRTTNQPIGGPATPQIWQGLQSWGGASPFFEFRIQGNNIKLHPTPTSAKNVYFEYFSKNYCKSAGGTEQSEWQADDDVGILDEDLMYLGVKYRFLKQRGFEFQESFLEYTSQVQMALTREGSSGVIDLSVGHSSEYDPRVVNIPDTGAG